MLNRRSLITGLISLVAAPAIVRAGSLMPVKALDDAAFEFSPYYTVIPINAPLYNDLAVMMREVTRAYLQNEYHISVRPRFSTECGSAVRWRGYAKTTHQL